MADEPVVVTEPEVKIESVAEPVVEPVKEPRTYTQEDLDRITAKVKKNARYQTKKEIEAYYQGRDSRPEQREVKPNGEDKPPERANFDSYEDFLDAKASFTGRKAAREERTKSEQETQERKHAEDRQKVFSDFQNKVKEKYPDLEERIEAIAEITMSDSVLQAIAESDAGPDILSYFAHTPKDCEPIPALSPSSAVGEIGKPEALFEKTEPKKPEPKKASSAPTPINP